MKAEIGRILAEAPRMAAPYSNPRTPAEIAAAVEAAQTHFAHLRGHYSVDQFLREKREEARREFAEPERPYEP